MSSGPVNPSSSPRDATRRAYVSPARDHAAAQTRAQLREAALGLFLERGFAGTTTKAIAAAAGVAERTLFLTFPSKAALLSEVIRVEVRGDAPDERVVNSAAWRDLLALPAEALLPAFARWIAEVHERSARIVAVAEAAAMTTKNPELLARRDLGHASSHATLKTVVDALDRAGALDAALSADDAADALDALASDAVYLRLVDERGWPTSRYIDWLATTARRVLLAP